MISGNHLNYSGSTPVYNFTLFNFSFNNDSSVTLCVIVLLCLGHLSYRRKWHGGYVTLLSGAAVLGACLASILRKVCTFRDARFLFGSLVPCFVYLSSKRGENHSVISVACIFSKLSSLLLSFSNYIFNIQLNLI